MAPVVSKRTPRSLLIGVVSADAGCMAVEARGPVLECLESGRFWPELARRRSSSQNPVHGTAWAHHNSSFVIRRLHLFCHFVRSSCFLFCCAEDGVYSDAAGILKFIVRLQPVESGSAVTFHSTSKFIRGAAGGHWASFIFGAFCLTVYVMADAAAYADGFHRVCDCCFVKRWCLSDVLMHIVISCAAPSVG